MNINVVCPHCFKVNRIPKKASYTKANCGGCKSSLLDGKSIGVNEDKLHTFLANSEIPVVVDFWAPWCGPCVQMAPAFEEVASQYPLQVVFLKVNTQDEQQLGASYRIESIPTLVVFKEGIETKRMSGGLNATQLKNWVEQSL